MFCYVGDGAGEWCVCQGCKNTPLYSRLLQERAAAVKQKDPHVSVQGQGSGSKWCVNGFSVPERGARACCCARECRKQGQRWSYRHHPWACNLQHPTAFPALSIAHDTPVPPPPRPLAMQAFAITAMMCRCKNSRCLKKYCDCFAVSEQQRQTGEVGAWVGRCRQVWDSRY